MSIVCPAVILVAIGANLPGADGRPPLAICRAAAASLDVLPGLRLVALSRWWTSAAIPPSEQPDYINGVARLDGWMAPDALLALLQGIEREAGRRPGPRNAARPLDLDIIAMGGLVRPAPDPVLPHPRAHLRRFVLAPLAEVAPGWLHPSLGRSVEALLAEAPAQRLEPMAGEPPSPEAGGRRRESRAQMDRETGLNGRFALRGLMY